jgi:hypothetical protein
VGGSSWADAVRGAAKKTLNEKSVMISNEIFFIVKPL